MTRKMRLLETKGQDSPEQQAKRWFLEAWMRAVNGMERFGVRDRDVALSPDTVVDVLERQVGPE